MPQAAVKQRVEGAMYRGLAASVSVIDEEQRVVELTFSSEYPVKRVSWFEDPWIEVLGHKKKEVDLTRFNSGAPVLYNHSRERGDRIGVIERGAIKDNRGTARVRFSKREDVDDVWNDVKEGVLRNVSVSYIIHERTLTKSGDDAPDEFRVTLWEPIELSMVDIPADPTVGVGRSLENAMHRIVDLNVAPSAPDQETVMDEGEEIRGVVLEATPAPDKPAAAKPGNGGVDLEAVRQAAIAEERTRVREINELFDSHRGHDDLRKICIEDGECDPVTALRQLFKAIAKPPESAQPAGSPHVMPGEDLRDKFRAAGVDNILVRGGAKKAEGNNEYRGYSLTDLARESLRLAGKPVSGMSLEMIGRAFTSTSDFPLILADAVRQTLREGYVEADETWSQWARTASLSDFKTTRSLSLSTFSDLDLIPEGGEYKHGVFAEEGQIIQLGTYGKLYNLTRQVIINDDLRAFTEIPRRMGRAAARVPGDLAYAVLTANAVLSDGVALFHATHGNLAGTGAVISVATLSAARVAMALQTDPNGNVIGSGMKLKHLLVPIALQSIANILRKSEYDPSVATNARAPNPEQGLWDVIPDARLDAVSSTAWYAVGDDTVEVAFLNGVQEPYLEDKDGWNVDGVEWKVRLDCAAAATTFRFMYKNPGP